MQPAINKDFIEVNDNKETMSNEERAYYTKKLQEAEKHNLIHTSTWTSEEFYKRKKEKYGL